MTRADEGVAVVSNQISVNEIGGKSAGVYLLFRQGVVVYVGMSMGPMVSRIGCHLLEGKNFDAVEFIQINSNCRSFVKEVESKFILQHRPIYNFGKGKKTKGRLLLSSAAVTRGIPSMAVT
jgi:Uri superfamily endonuclease